MEKVGLHAPYSEAHINLLYNLLFCDDISLFRNTAAENHGTVWSEIFADTPDYKKLEQVAANSEEESRIRALAYNRLRADGHAVVAKILLGVIVEVRLDQGLDTLAAYADGRVRYLNQTGSAAIFEGGPPEVEAIAKDLVSVSQPLVNAIGPWDKERLPPPAPGNVRITFVVSDGLYFGEGPFEMLSSDAMGGPVIAKATELLNAVVEINAGGDGKS